MSLNCTYLHRMAGTIPLLSLDLVKLYGQGRQPHMRNQGDQGGQRVSALQEGASDIQTDGVLQLRLDNAKLMRSEAALRAKGSSLEEALKALEARLSEYEAQAMAEHAALEHGKHQVRGPEAFGRSEGRFSTSALFPRCCTHD